MTGLPAGPLDGLRVAVLERTHPAGHQGALVEVLLPALRAAGAHAVRVDPARPHRLDVRPDVDLALLKSGSAAALHLASAWDAHGVRVVNTPAATRLTRDKLAATALLGRAGLPVPSSWGLWLPGDPAAAGSAVAPVTDALPAGDRVVVKAASGSQGQGLHWTTVADLPRLAGTLAAGPWLVMADVLAADRERGTVADDLKVFVVGDWTAAVHRPFPARDLAAKRGRPAAVPAEVAAATREAGRVLGLDCYGCDFVATPAGWRLVDVNAFPGYKGVDAAPAVVRLLARSLAVAS